MNRDVGCPNAVHITLVSRLNRFAASRPRSPLTPEGIAVVRVIWLTAMELYLARQNPIPPNVARALVREQSCSASR